MNHAWARKHQILGQIAAQYGQPTPSYRPATLASLVHIILEQQISVAAANTQFRRLRRALGGISGQRLAEAGAPGLRNLGLTRQKARYCAGLGEAICARQFSLTKIARLPNAEAQEMLQALPGIGPWTASIFLMMALRRADVWPPGDLALIRACDELCPAAERADDGAPFAPWRTTGAFYLWHYYRHTR